MPALVDRAAQETVPALSLEQALDRAYRVQPSVVRAQSDVHNAEQQKREAVGSWFPSVNFNSTGSSTWNEGIGRIDTNTGLPVGGNQVSRNIRFGFSGSWDVFTGFRRSAVSRQARAQLTAADADLIDARFQTMLLTKQQFYAALYATELVRVRQAGVRRAEEQLKVSINKLRTGSATRSDSLRSVVNLGNALVQRVNAETQLATAEASLARLVGLDGRVRALDDSSFHRVAFDIPEAELRQEALASSPAVLSAEASTGVSLQSWKAAKAAWWPTLTLSGNWDWSGNNQVNNYQLLKQRSLVARLTWPLFNGFTRERNVAAQANGYDVAVATAADTRRQVVSTLITRSAELKAASLRVEIARESVAAAEEDLRVQQERYRLGASTIIEVLTSQEALTQAEVDGVNARFDLLLAKAQIEALVGRSL